PGTTGPTGSFGKDPGGASRSGIGRSTLCRELSGHPLSSAGLAPVTSWEGRQTRRAGAMDAGLDRRRGHPTDGEQAARLLMPVMKRNTEIQKIAFVGDYLPRKCGIATFTYDVCTSTATQYPGTDCFVVPVNDTPLGYDYPAEVRFEIEEPEVDSYL